MSRQVAMRMFWTGLVFAVLAVLAVTGSVPVRHATGADPAAKASEKAAAAKPSDEKDAQRAADEHAATKELRDSPNMLTRKPWAFMSRATRLPQEVHRWSLILLVHELDLATDDEKKFMLTQAHLDRMTVWPMPVFGVPANWNITWPKRS